MDEKMNADPGTGSYAGSGFFMLCGSLAPVKLISQPETSRRYDEIVKGIRNCGHPIREGVMPANDS